MVGVGGGGRYGERERERDGGWVKGRPEGEGGWPKELTIGQSLMGASGSLMLVGWY